MADTIERWSRRKPMATRFLCCAWIIGCMGGSAHAQETSSFALRETEAVARALARTALIDVLEGQVEIESGRGRVAAAYANPEVAYVREQTFGSRGTGEDYLTVSQTVDLGNRRGLQGRAGATRAQAAQAEGESARIGVAAEARLRFHDVLHRQGRAACLEAWVVRIDEALAIVSRREQRGDAALYDRRRLERERFVAGARLESERAGVERAQGALTSLIGWHGAAPLLQGNLLPDSEPATAQDLRTISLERPDLRALRLRLDASVLERSAAARWWAPDLRLEGGWKGVALAGPERADGFLLGVSLSLPLWHRLQGLAQIAQAEARAARGRQALLESALHAQLGAVRAESSRLRRAAVELRAHATSASADLVRIATAGYAGGELGLLELLDAYRGASDDALSILDMEHAARRARIELDRMTGVEAP